MMRVHEVQPQEERPLFESVQPRLRLIDDDVRRWIPPQGIHREVLLSRPPLAIPEIQFLVRARQQTILGYSGLDQLIQL